MGAVPGNVFNSGRNPFSWEQYDVLPLLVRRVIMYAPIALGTERATRYLARGVPVEDVARQEVAVVRHWSCVGIVEDYGPDHPQAPKAAA